VNIEIGNFLCSGHAHFDDFQIVSDSNSLGDSILIWDFLDTVPLGCMQTHQLRDKHNSLLMYIRRHVHT